MKNSKCFFWVDIETTGLNPSSDHVLEIAVIITDSQLNKLAEAEYVLQRPPQPLSDFHEVVQKMHTDNGLWEATAQGLDHYVVEQSIVKLIDTHCDGKPMPAGNSVHFDMGFLKNDFPVVARKLQYRLFDVRVLQTAMSEWADRDCPVADDTNHRAKSDIEVSLDRAKWFKRLHTGFADEIFRVVV
jgi:oligoribonuclease